MSLEWDAIVMVDADSIIERGLLRRVRGCAGAAARGVAGPQRSRDRRPPARPGGTGVVRDAGRADAPRPEPACTCCVRLRGTGMVLARRIVDAVPVPGAGVGGPLVQPRPVPRRHPPRPRGDGTPPVVERRYLGGGGGPADPLRSRSDVGRPREFARAAPAAPRPRLARSRVVPAHPAVRGSRCSASSPRLRWRGSRARRCSRSSRSVASRCSPPPWRSRWCRRERGAHVAGSRDRAVVRALEGGHPDPCVAPPQDARSAPSAPRLADPARGVIAAPNW